MKTLHTEKKTQLRHKLETIIKEAEPFNNELELIGDDCYEDEDEE